MDGEVATAAGRKGKVRVVARGPETLAVISAPGRPTRLAIDHAETAILHAIASTRWGSTGGACVDRGHIWSKHLLDRAVLRIRPLLYKWRSCTIRYRAGQGCASNFGE
jgi:hypothetical protein